MNAQKTPLVVLVEGVNDERVLRVVLSRGQELGFASLSEKQVEFRRHASEVCTSGAGIARSLAKQYNHSLLVWDHEGSAYQTQGHSPQRAQGIVQSQLNTYGLRDCSKAIVIAPELEIWLWSDLNAVAKALQKSPADINHLLNTLAGEGLTPDEKPKETLRQLAFLCDDRADSALYEQITTQADLSEWLRRHSSFKALVRALRRWFPLASVIAQLYPLPTR